MSICSFTSKSSLFISEEELVLGLKKRDIAAFEYLYDYYAYHLYKIILRITTDKFLAEDVLQDVFIRIWSNIETYDHNKGRLFTWMSHSAKHAAINFLKLKQGRKADVTCDLSVGLMDCLFICNSIDIMDIRKQLIKLEHHYQVVIELAYFYDLTNEQISKLLNLPLGTVKTRRKVALQQLRKFYNVQLLN